MTREDIQATVASIILTQTEGVNIKEITPDINLYLAFGFDSLDVATIVSMCNERYNIRLPYEDMDIHTPNDITEAIIRELYQPDPCQALRDELQAMVDLAVSGRPTQDIVEPFIPRVIEICRTILEETHGKKKK